MPGPKTNEREGTRAQLRYSLMSAYKVRQVLDLIRGKHVDEAADVLRFTEREAARVVGKVLASAVANADHNDEIASDELFVSACYADEGRTLRRHKPRARGRATRIRKRSCHITIIVSRMPDSDLARHRARREAELELRRRRTQGTEGARRRRARGRTAAEDAGVVDQQEAAIEQAEDAVTEQEVIVDAPVDESGAIEAADQESSAASGEASEEPAEGATEVAAASTEPVPGEAETEPAEGAADKPEAGE